MLVHKYKEKYKKSYFKFLRISIGLMLVANVIFLGYVFVGQSEYTQQKAENSLATNKVNIFIKPPSFSFKTSEKFMQDLNVHKESVELSKVKIDLYNRKVRAVESFLRSYNAPLAKNAKDFVDAAEKYGIDYRLLPAISIVESSGGKHLFKPYNPFGWGKHGYPSFKVAIYDVARGMSVYYYKYGLKDPRAIAYKYNPVTPEAWGNKVYRLMNKMPAY